MLTAAEVYRKAFVQGMRPESRLTVSEWADTYRMLSQRASAEPGRWRTSRTPYLKEIMDCLSVSSHWESVVFMKGSQIGAPLSLRTPIAMPDGFTTMGDVSVGDRVLDETGAQCNVTYISPIFVGRDCYRITLSDGSQFTADGEHRWTVRDQSDQTTQTITTTEIFVNKPGTFAIDNYRANAKPACWEIVAIQPAPTEPVRCIAVDSPRNLYLIGTAMVPTHNTECGNNWIGYIIHHAPGPVMSIQPTVEMAKRNSKQRINSLVEESPVLKQLVQSPRSRDSGNTILSKEFPGGLLVMTGANSAVGLRSMAARDLFLDEIDAYPMDVDGEGDPISLAMARTRTFARRKIFLVSTPIDEGTSRIQKAYEGSDQRHFFVPCPFCDHFQVLTFERIRWAPGFPDTAAYYCENESCGQRIENHHKTVMLERGEWRATAPGDGRTAGFHLPSYYSPVGWFSFGDAANMWDRADRLNDDSMRKVFVNTVDAKTWRTRGDAPDWKRLYERAQAEDLPKNGTVPLRGLFLTAGADVQKDRIEIQVIAWGRGKESWMIDHHIEPGDPSRPEVWAKITQYANRTFVHETGLDLPIVRFAIDSGDQTQTVYAWVREQGPGRVIAIKGFDTGAAIVGTPSAVDLNWQGRKFRRAVKLWPVNVSALKVEFYGWLKLDSPTVESGQPFPGGYCHFPPMPEEFFKQLTAEQLVTKMVRGYQKAEWQKTRDRNEALDARVYGRAAASQFGMDRFSPRDWDFLEAPVRDAIATKKAEEKQASEQAAGVPAPPGPAPSAPAPASGWIPRKQGWFDK